VPCDQPQVQTLAFEEQDVEWHHWPCAKYFEGVIKKGSNTNIRFYKDREPTFYITEPAPEAHERGHATHFQAIINDFMTCIYSHIYCIGFGTKKYQM